jgi:hypothetical protein
MVTSAISSKCGEAEFCGPAGMSGGISVMQIEPPLGLNPPLPLSSFLF